MSYFSGFTGFSSAQYHVYNPESDVLKDIGLASYTRNSIEFFGKDNNGQYDKEILEYFTREIPYSQLLCDNNFGMMMYDEISETYKEVKNIDCFDTPSGVSSYSLLDFQQKWDKLQKGELSTSSQEGWRIHYTYTAINNSLEGCLKGNARYSILGESHESPIRIYFYTGNKQVHDRKVAFNGVPTMVVTPIDSAGQKYSHYETSKLSPGDSRPEYPGGPANPNNSVAAEPLYRYDNVLKKIEFGTMQILARLLGDLDGIKLPPLPLQQIDPVTQKLKPLNTTYDDQRLKYAPTVDAIPLQAHNGNPKEFGPNSYSCTGEKQKIKVVNLTPRKYKRGELVLCSLINGMWVPMGYDNPDLTPQEIPIVWRDIQKYIVDQEGLFKQNDRQRSLYQNTYEQYIKYKFYQSLQNAQQAPIWRSSGNIIQDVKNWTLFNPDIDEVNKQALTTSNLNAPIQDFSFPTIIPSFNYGAVYDTDVLGKSLGGLRSFTMLRATNAKYAPKVDNIIPSYATTFSFGMYFTDGYTIDSISRSRTRSNLYGIKSSGTDNIFVEQGVLNFSSSNDLPLEYGSFYTTWDNQLEPNSNFAHFPAQVGIHSSGNLGVLNCFRMMKLMEDVSTSNDAWDLFKNYSESTQRYATLYNNNNQPVYNFTPVSTHKIQFNSLGTFSALYGSKDFTDNVALGYDGKKFKDHLYNYAKDKFGNIRKNANPDAPYYFAYYRRGSPLDAIDQSGRLFNIEGVFKSTFAIGERFFFKRSSLNSRGDIFFRTDNPPTIEGGVGLFPKEISKGGAYLYGVIAARGTIKAGEGVKFTVGNNWGINVVLGSESTKDLTFGVSPVIGGGAGLASLTANPSRINDKVFYGSPGKDLDQPGSLLLQARVYDHCENVIYDGRYGVPFFFNPNDSTVDFADIKNEAGTQVNKDNYKSIVKIQNPIRRGQMLNLGGFTYVKKVISIGGYTIEPDSDWVEPEPDPDNPDEDPPSPLRGGEGYVIGDTVSFSGAGSDAPTVYQVTKVGFRGNIEMMEIIELGNLSPESFEKDIYGVSNGQGITKQAVIKANYGIVRKILGKDYQPTFHGEAILTPDDNDGYGPNNKGWVQNTTTTSIRFSQSKFDNKGLYDIFLMFINDVGAYPENNTGGIDPAIPDPFPFQHLSVEITSI